MVQEQLNQTLRHKTRQYAASLIEAVVDERMEPRVALNNWPDVVMGKDPALDIAYQSLWHFEADEDLQKTELFYMDAQLELLNQIARRLQAGQDLPNYFSNQYDPAILSDFYRPKTLVTDLKTFTHELGQYYWQTLKKSWKLSLSALGINF